MRSPIAAVEAAAPASDSYTQRFSVSYEYRVVFTRDVFAGGNPVLAEILTQPTGLRAKLVVFVDDGLVSADPGLLARIDAYAIAHKDVVDLVCFPEAVSGGEACKNDGGLVGSLQSRLVALGIDRHAFVVAIGGGAFLDLIGFVAATVHRGIRHIRIPTTVLAQNDLGVGVKNGVNAFGQKNLLGTFVPPYAVLNDADFLLTLNSRDKRSGMAEAVKVALIRDASFFHWIERNVDDLRAFQAPAVSFAIRRCAELHMDQIASGGDPFERGSARPLDFGHWSAHKLELLTKHTLRHGEAVAIGIALDARYSTLRGYLPAGEDQRIVSALQALGLPIYHQALDSLDPHGGHNVLAGLRDFQDHLGGELSITLLRAIGSAVEVHEMHEPDILQSISWLRQGGAL